MENRELRKLFQEARNGDKDAMQKILLMFKPLIYKNSFVNGQFDEDCFQELNIKLMKCIQSFEFLGEEDIPQFLKKYFQIIFR